MKNKFSISKADIISVGTLMIGSPHNSTIYRGKESRGDIHTSAGAELMDKIIVMKAPHGIEL